MLQILAPVRLLDLFHHLSVHILLDLDIACERQLTVITERRVSVLSSVLSIFGAEASL
jgi:hypothetical protein